VQKVDVKKTFGTSVRAWRKRLGLSQEVLAERANLHRTYVSDVERGARNLSLESITRMARALDIPVAELFPHELPESSAGPAPGGAAAGSAAPANVARRIQTPELVEILLVEDNLDDVELTMHAFQQARFSNRIQVAADGQEALNYLFCEGPHASRADERPQVVLLDLYLPKVSGIEVLRRMKSEEKTRTIPVVILTISQVFSDFAECQRLGAETYVIKPLNFQRLSQITPRLHLDWALLKSGPGTTQPARA
jgi:CheY-like chemotaxis protein/DNA-binding XRE family transcriptional regulator